MVSIKKSSEAQGSQRAETFARKPVEAPAGTPPGQRWTVSSKQRTATAKATEVLAAALKRQPAPDEVRAYVAAIRSANPQVDLEKLIPGDRLALPTPQTTWTARGARSVAPELVSLSRELADQLAALPKNGQLSMKQLTSVAFTLRKVHLLQSEEKLELAKYDPEAFANRGRLFEAPGVKAFVEHWQDFQLSLLRAERAGAPITKEAWPTSKQPPLLDERFSEDR